MNNTGEQSASTLAILAVTAIFIAFMVNQSIVKEVRWQTVITHNGIAVYATWTTVASVNIQNQNHNVT